MTMATTLLHVQGQPPEAIEQALDAIFAGEERARVLRLEGTFSAVLARVVEDNLQASYRYLLCRPHPGSAWTPVLELGNRTVGLDTELSRRLDGATIFTTFVYGEAVSGYRVTRNGAQVDSYLSDPTFFAEIAEDVEPGEAGQGGATSAAGLTAVAPEPLDGEPGSDPEAERGHPERFADLLPAGTAPDDFVRIVLRPGWWQEHTSDAPPNPDVADAEDDLVDEVDRMRCIALALELWGPAEYPFSGDLEDIPNAVAGPAIALAYT